MREFIEKIIVHQAEKVNGKKRQAVEIIYNCVGVIPNHTRVTKYPNNGKVA